MRRRLISEHFKNNGRPKKGFQSQRKAQRFLVEMEWTTRYTIYRCSFCNEWHLASKR